METKIKCSVVIQKLKPKFNNSKYHIAIQNVFFTYFIKQVQVVELKQVQ